MKINEDDIVKNICWAQGVLYGIVINCNGQVREVISDIIKTLDTIVSAIQINTSEADLIKIIDFAIQSTGQSDIYSTGFCNGLVYAKSLIDNKEPDFYSYFERRSK